jgi:hypothetical protein
MIISAYAGPPEPGGKVKIFPGPLYSLERVKALAAEQEALILWTQKCRRDIQNLHWDVTEVSDLLLGLSSRNYIDSEWCENGKQAWAACDAYLTQRKEWVEHMRKQVSMLFFVKFAIGKTGKVVLLVSCHL